MRGRSDGERGVIAEIEADARDGGESAECRADRLGDAIRDMRDHAAEIAVAVYGSSGPEADRLRGHATMIRRIADSAVGPEGGGGPCSP